MHVLKFYANKHLETSLSEMNSVNLNLTGLINIKDLRK